MAIHALPSCWDTRPISTVPGAETGPGGGSGE